jgi:pimeloyl-ACP methyl ester carboxylesterase
MPKRYSDDLRERVIEAVEAEASAAASSAREVAMGRNFSWSVRIFEGRTCLTISACMKPWRRPLAAIVEKRACSFRGDRMGGHRDLSASFSLSVVFLLFMTLQAICRSPVVVIPGIEGSKLCDSFGNVLWGDRSSYTAERINALRLPPDPTTRDKGIHSCGLIQSLSIIPLLWDSNVYSGLLNTLKQIGYQDRDIIQFDYDWRLSNFENAKRLQEKIDGLSLDPHAHVDILAHSMGGLIARIYLQNMNGFSHVDNLILMGTPSFGSARVFQNLRDGFDHWPNAWSGGLDEIQRTILSFPSTYELLPTYTDCCGFSKGGDRVNVQYVDILEPNVWKRFSWLPADFKAGPRFDAMSAYLLGAKQLKSLMQSPITMDPEVTARIHFIGNGFLNTWSRVFFDDQTGAISGSLLRPGDGTVLLFSATNGNPSQVQVSRKEHELVFVGDEPELVIKAVLVDKKNWTSGSVEFAQTLIDAQGSKFRVESAALNVVPRIAGPGEEIVLRVDLSGGGLNGAKLSNASVDVLRDDRVIARMPLRDLGNSGAIRSVGSNLRAPSDPGAYQVRVTLPGIEGLEAIFATVGQ